LDPFLGVVPPPITALEFLHLRPHVGTLFWIQNLRPHCGARVENKNLEDIALENPALDFTALEFAALRNTMGLFVELA
jgi:hypothetical protein